MHIECKFSCRTIDADHSVLYRARDQQQLGDWNIHSFPHGLCSARLCICPLLWLAGCTLFSLSFDIRCISIAKHWTAQKYRQACEQVISIRFDSLRSCFWSHIYLGSLSITSRSLCIALAYRKSQWRKCLLIVQDVFYQVCALLCMLAGRVMFSLYSNRHNRSSREFDCGFLMCRTLIGTSSNWFWTALWSLLVSFLQNYPWSCQSPSTLACSI